ncbi:MAG: hypothetical protein DRJ55_03750 [Thermoprotei archaeon]|nr:MAG: hypothetical protein DRJ55_03750 [Thermoprotei archaeon]HDJ97202.1 hypothetical protein [Thermofilum sp.]
MAAGYGRTSSLIIASSAFFVFVAVLFLLVSVNVLNVMQLVSLSAVFVGASIAIKGALNIGAKGSSYIFWWGGLVTLLAFIWCLDTFKVGLNMYALLSIFFAGLAANVIITYYLFRLEGK